MVIPNAAQEPADVEEATPLVLVSVRPSRGATSESVGELIEQVTLMRVETLAQGAVEVTAAPKTDEAAAGTGAAGAPGGSGSSLQLLAESAAADLVLSVVYGGVREITVVCTVYDPASGRTTGPVYETTTLSLTFDQTVESLVDAALAPYAGRLEELLRADEEPAQPKTAAVAERPSPPTPTEAATEAPGAPPVPADDEPPASPGRPAAGIAVATGAFLPLGGGSGYLSVGAVQSAYASFPLAPVPWVAVGMEGGVVLVDATGASAHSRVYLVPFAASVRLATSNGSRIRPLAALSGGGSLISVDPNGTGRLWKLVGYAAGATGVGVALGSRFSLMVLTSMHVFFEPGRPIVAFAPSVSAQLDL
jgi:hypothetical protein